MNIESTQTYGLPREGTYAVRFKIGLVYGVLLAGGLWHLLGWFQAAMAVLAGPVVILIGLVLIGEYLGRLPTDRRPVFVGWTLGVLLGGYLIEAIGIRTGVIFGQYAYGEVLRPMLGGVPVAMSFAWAGMLLASHGITGRMFRQRQPGWLVRAAMTGLAMVVFDLLLEQVAISLGYWDWFGAGIPLQNYVAWFGMSVVAAGIGLQFRVFPAKAPAMATHVYLAQILYFGLVLLK